MRKSESEKGIEKGDVWLIVLVYFDHKHHIIYTIQALYPTSSRLTHMYEVIIYKFLKQTKNLRYISMLLKNEHGILGHIGWPLYFGLLQETKSEIWYPCPHHGGAAPVGSTAILISRPYSGCKWNKTSNRIVYRINSWNGHFLILAFGDRIHDTR